MPVRKNIGDGEVTYTLVPGVPDLVGADIECTGSWKSLVSPMYTPVRTGCNPQLESESTGKRSGQQNGVLADEGAIRGEEDLG